MTAYTPVESIDDLERALAHVQWLHDLTAGQGLNDDPTRWLGVAASSIYRELQRAYAWAETVGHAEAIRRRVLASWRGNTPPPGTGAADGQELVARAGISDPPLAGADLVSDAGALWDAPVGAGEAVEAYRG